LDRLDSELLKWWNFHEPANRLPHVRGSETQCADAEPAPQLAQVNSPPALFSTCGKSARATKTSVVSITRFRAQATLGLPLSFPILAGIFHRHAASGAAHHVFF
jgi:hypothetical protein